MRQCPQCAKSFSPNWEPLLPSPLPDHPWEKVGADLFDLQGTTYLLVVDYFSQNPEFIKLSSTTSRSINTALKSIFSRHGNPSILMSDNGPQFSSKEMVEFTRTYAFTRYQQPTLPTRQWTCGENCEDHQGDVAEVY